MHIADICTCPISLKTAPALADWNAMVLAFLAHKPATPTHLGAVLNAEPRFAMGHAARGLFSLMMGRAELTAVAQEALRAAKAGHAGNPREAAWVSALEAWLGGSPSAAIAVIEDVLARQPEDTLSAKLSHGIRFILGDSSGMRRSVEAVMPAHGPDHPLRGYLMGCHAFTLEETGDYAAAERVGLDGLTQTTDDAWGLHAVAHVYDMTARPDTGIALIQGNKCAWDGSNNFRYHVWWHQALLHMDRGELDVALGLYDAQIRADKTDDYRDISNATSLLMRLELEGVDVGPRWDELAALSEARAGDGCLVFADLHYMLALAGADHAQARSAMMARFARDAQGTGDMPKRYAHPGLAAIAGLNAFAEGRYDLAFRQMVIARPALQSIGGSHAQRDVFERMTIDAGLRAGHFDQVSHLIEQRSAQRAGNTDLFARTRLAQIDRARRIPAQ